MKGFNTAVGCALLLASLTLAALLAAQARGSVLYAHGGGYSPTQDVDPGGFADFDTGFNVGGGLGYAINEQFAVRGDFTFARSEANDARAVGGVASLNGQEFNRFFYGGDIQWKIPTGAGSLRTFSPEVVR